MPGVTPGTVLGHEAVGTVDEVGAGGDARRAGDRVLVSCISACGRCRYCKEGRYGQCLGGGGWIFGHTDRRPAGGVRAGAVRRQLRSTSCPSGSATSRSCSWPTSCPPRYEVGVLNGMVAPGDTVAIVGAGPIGLAAVLTARLYTPGPHRRDRLADSRLRARKRVRRRHDHQQRHRGRASAMVMELTGRPRRRRRRSRRSASRRRSSSCTELVRPGGRVANIGVHGHPATLHLETLWIRDVTITTGLVDTYTIPQLMSLIPPGQLDPPPSPPIASRSSDTMEAYDTFADAANTDALKVVLQGSPVEVPDAEAEVPVLAGA